MRNEIKIHTKINLQTANCFKLLFGVLITFIVGTILELNNEIALWMGVGSFVTGGIVGLIKYKNVGFYLLSISLGFIIFSNSYKQDFITTDYSVPSQHAIIQGKVKSILNRKIDKKRVIVEGNFSSATFSNVYNTAILLTISGKTDVQIGDKIIADSYIRPPRKNIFEYDFNEIVYNKSIGTNWLGYTNSNKISITEKANIVYRISNTCYNLISQRIDSIFSIQTAGFVKAIILADRTDLSYEDKNKFALAGVAHILSLSGFHIGIISAIILFFISLFKPNKWIKFILFSIFVIAFVFLTGFVPSAIRAGLMAIFFMFGKTIFRETNMLNVVSIVLLGVIIFNPSLLYSVGFQMSLISVLGIFLFYDLIKNKLLELVKNNIWNNRISNNIIYSVAITLSASMMINPLVAYYFHNLSIISPLTNIFVVPIFSLCLIFAVITIILSFIYFPLGLIYGYVVELLTKLCFGITYIATNFKYSSISNYEYLFLLSIIISFVLLYIFTSKNSKQIIFRLCVTCVILISTIYILDVEEKPNELKLYVKDKYCLLNIPLSDGSNFIWIADKKPNIKNRQKYYNDNGLIKFIQNSKIKYIAINGNYGKEFTNIYCKNISIIELSHLQQRNLEKKYLNGKYIYKYLQ